MVSLILYLIHSAEHGTGFLIVLCLDLEIALCVLADWANFRSLLSYYNVTAV